MKIVKIDDLDTYQDYAREDIPIVKEILDKVRKEGDDAVRYYTKKFDGVDAVDLEITKQQIKEAYSQVDEETISAIKKAAENIRKFAKRQMMQEKDFEMKCKYGVLGQKIIPIERVGCYVPGGIYPLPSSALMGVIPAKVAGVKEVIVSSPKIRPATIVAADIAGADRIFSIGGVQAIAAMAYGTCSVPRVDKIVGPGNKYVSDAKRQVYGDVGIDFVAGPSEVLIICDDSCDIRYVAADLLAQAEHDKDARCYLVALSEEVALKVADEVERQLQMLNTKDTAKAALESSFIFVVDCLEEACLISNKIAPEHLELQIKDPSMIIGKLNNYGSLFVGKYSAEVFGDYCSGTNHILPTNKASRYTGGLSVRDFVKVVTYQMFDDKPLEMIDVASRIADVEGLEGHKKAAEIRR